MKQKISTQTLAILFVIVAALLPMLLRAFGLVEPNTAAASVRSPAIEAISAAAYLGGTILGGLGLVSAATKIFQNSMKLVLDKEMKNAILLMAAGCILLMVVQALN